MRRRFLLLGAAVALLIGLSGGAAFAYFTSSGSGSGTATAAGAANPVTIGTNATAGALLQPGGTGDLVITATNPDNVAVQITSVTLGTITGCTTPAITLTTPTSNYLPFTIPAHANNQRMVISGALTMGTGASNDCQGVSFTIPLTVSVHQ